MQKIYACLIGKWVCLNDDPDCRVGIHSVSPSQWWEENAEIWNPSKIKEEDTLYQMPYIHIGYKGKDYRINPIFIQIVTD